VLVLQSTTDLATIFNSMAKSDLTVCRTWGFADRTEAGTAPYNIAYQLWENSKATVNTGDNGLATLTWLWLRPRPPASSWSCRS